MKKYKNGILFFIFTLLAFSCTGCGAGSSSSASAPGQVTINGIQVDYNEPVPSGLEELVHVIGTDGSGSKLSMQMLQSDDNYIITNEDGIVRGIHITDNRIKTYKGIAVGNKLSVLSKNFTTVDDTFSLTKTVYFDGLLEIERPETSDGHEDNIIIMYHINDDEVIDFIEIYDMYFGNRMQ